MSNIDKDAIIKMATDAKDKVIEFCQSEDVQKVVAEQSKHLKECVNKVKDKIKK